jgi:FKBP-type peptidyl-prolyl cis-trans isomerase (trigger factor)
MQTKIEKLPKATIKLTVTVESDKVKDTYEKVLDSAVQKTAIEGFRPGKAPREMVRDKVGVSNLYGDVINDLLQAYYPQALKENHIAPVANPRVEIKEFDLDKDFTFEATIPVKPEVKVGEFKTELKKRYEERVTTRKKENEEKLKKGEKLDDSHIHIGTTELIDAIVKATEVEISDVLIDEETNRMMTRLVDQAQSIGLSLEQYLKSQNKTAEQLHKEYETIAEKNMKAEFALTELVTKEKVEIADKEIEDMIAAVGTEEASEKLKDPFEKLYIKSILQKNKLLSQLAEEIEGVTGEEHAHEQNQATE